MKETRDSIDDLRPGTQVIYAPSHAEGDETHPDCEEGFVTSYNDEFVFCRFWRGHTNELRTRTNSEACHPRHLLIKDTRSQVVVDRMINEIRRGR